MIVVIGVVAAPWPRRVVVSLVPVVGYVLPAGKRDVLRGRISGLLRSSLLRQGRFLVRLSTLPSGTLCCVVTIAGVKGDDYARAFAADPTRLVA